MKQIYVARFWNCDRDICAAQVSSVRFLAGASWRQTAICWAVRNLNPQNSELGCFWCSNLHLLRSVLWHLRSPHFGDTSFWLLTNKRICTFTYKTGFGSTCLLNCIQTPYMPDTQIWQPTHTLNPPTPPLHTIGKGFWPHPRNQSMDYQSWEDMLENSMWRTQLHLVPHLCPSSGWRRWWCRGWRVVCGCSSRWGLLRDVSASIG